MQRDLSTEELALTLLLTPGIGSRTVSRFLLWTHGRVVPASQWPGLDARDLAAELPDALHGLVAPLAQPDGEVVDRAQRQGARVRESGGTALLITDRDYPDDLRVGLGTEAPPVLWVVGDLEAFESDRGAIVGTREPSEEGVAIAARCSEWIVERDGCVVSGGAQGIDSVAHESAVHRGGRTLVILPQGLLTYRVPQPLAEAIDDGRVVVVSQFAPDAPWSTGSAIERNATVIALSRIACVIEPRDSGGSVRTAGIAIEQDVPLYIHWPRIGGPEPGARASLGKAHPLLTHENALDVDRLAAGWEHGASRTSSQQPLF